MRDPQNTRQQRLRMSTERLVDELEKLEREIDAQSRQLAEGRLRAALLNVSDGFALYGPDGKLEICNDSFRNIHGYSVAETIPGVATYDSLGALDRQKSSDDRQPLNFVTRLGTLQKEGPTKILQFIGDRVHERRQAATPEGGIVSIIRDITDRTRLEEALQLANETLRQHSQAKSDFLSNMAHEFRTPLNAILGFAECMEQRLYGDLGNARYEEYAGIIVESGHHLLSLVNDVLDISKIEAGALDIRETELDLGSLVRSVHTMLQQRVEAAGIRLLVDCDRAPSKIVGDERQLRQVLLNLLSNAIKFTPAGGTVTLSVGLNGDNKVQFRVSDTGTGIAASDLPTIFEPFRQARAPETPRRVGTGLGLALSKSLVTAHGGTIDVESSLGDGTQVTVLLPAERICQV